MDSMDKWRRIGSKTSEDKTMTAAHVGMWVMLIAMVGVSQPAAYGKAEADLEQARIAKGKNLYARNCAGCHGAKGTGEGYKLLGPDPANLTLSLTTKKSDAALLNAIHEGKPNMPSWKVRLSEQDSRAVLAYIRTLAK
jgi:cbb3-type cytochrome c oxidase subunit III